MVFTSECGVRGFVEPERAEVSRQATWRWLREVDGGRMSRSSETSSSRSSPTDGGTRPRLLVAKLDEKYPTPAPVFGDLEEFDEAGKAGTTCEFRGDVGERNLVKRCDHDLSRSQEIATPDPDVRPLPEPDAAGDLSGADALPQGFDELHGQA
jgi:hypothetical protein